MPESRTPKPHEARGVSATVWSFGAELSFVTREGDELIIRMDRQILALLQHHIAHALAPTGASSEQP